MRYGRGRGDWYDIPLFGVAALLVYPDVVLEWLSEVTGRALGWLHLLALEAAGVMGMILAMLWLMPMYPKLMWWHPVLYVGMLALFRVIMACVTRLVDFWD
ncbi:MAG: hypothetical protein J0L84_08135 [Verrucomicrobia bacterium]|nr:hypothetical protein [Verrucomicrobiota bacterium]